MSHAPHIPAAAFRPLTSIAQLDEAVARSWEQPVTVFKHSLTCGISAVAHEDLGALVDRGGAPGAWYLVDVRAHRDVSTAIAERFRVRHESPQVLVIRSGQVRWSASHYRVTADRVQAALTEAQP